MLGGCQLFNFLHFINNIKLSLSELNCQLIKSKNSTLLILVLYCLYILVSINQCLILSKYLFCLNLQNQNKEHLLSIKKFCILFKRVLINILNLEKKIKVRFSYFQASTISLEIHSLKKLLTFHIVIKV